MVACSFEVRWAPWRSAEARLGSRYWGGGDMVLELHVMAERCISVRKKSWHMRQPHIPWLLFDCRRW